MTEKVVIKELIRSKFQDFLRNQRVLFFSAPCGFGKTVTARALLAGRQVRCLNGAEDGAAAFSGSDAWEILLIDDFQYFQEEADLQALCERIPAAGISVCAALPGNTPGLPDGLPVCGTYDRAGAEGAAV